MFNLIHIMYAVRRYINYIIALRNECNISSNTPTLFSDTLVYWLLVHLVLNAKTMLKPHLSASPEPKRNQCPQSNVSLYTICFT